MRTDDGSTLVEHADASNGADARRERREAKREERRAARRAKPARVMPPRRAPLALTLVFAIGVAVAVVAYIAALITGVGWLAPIALTVGGAAVVAPVLAAGWLAGRAIRRGFGPVGLVFALGLFAAASSPVVEISWVSYAGWAAMAAAAVALFLAVKIPAWRRARSARARS